MAAVCCAQLSGPQAAKEIEKMIDEVDVDKDGKIDFSEFCTMLRKGAPGCSPSACCWGLLALLRPS